MALSITHLKKAAQARRMLQLARLKTGVPVFKPTGARHA
jgi:hypothetical protein